MFEIFNNMAKEFVLSDESKNSYGFKVLTNGINLDRFLQNPIMYYNHDRKAGVIGKWENVHVAGKKLLGTPVFDMNDPQGAKIENQVENGFLKGASIGIDNPVIDEINGEMVIVSCDLYECSICDIPSNGNALTLYMKNKPVKNRIDLIRLSATINNRSKSDLKPILEVLGLPNDAIIEDIIEAIRLLKSSNKPENVVNEAIKMKLIASDEKIDLLSLGKSNPLALTSYLNKRKAKALKEREDKVLSLVCTAIRDGRIDADASGTVKLNWLNAFKIDFEGTSRLLESIPKHISLSTIISDSKNLEREDWTLEDYRKKDPKALKNNPALYERLLEKEREKDRTNVKNNI